MKKLLTTFGVLAVLAIPTQSYAWTYDGIGSLNPFTLFGTRTYNTTDCGCQKVEKCKKPKLTKCEKLHGVKIKKAEGMPCGCAAPVQEYVKIVPQQNATPCTDCQRAF